MFFCLGGSGLVGVLGLGGSLQGGLVAALGADFAHGGFAGQGAGAIVGRDVMTGLRLGPMFGFFHERIFAEAEAGVSRVFTPWPGAAGEIILAA